MDKKKFAAVDQRYLSNRKALSERSGPKELWNVIDHWPLYVGVSNLARNLAIYEILKQQALVPGDIAEFGSWRGANLMFMAKVMSILDPLSPKRVHCFESFEGLQDFKPEDGKQGQAGGYKGSLEELQEMLNLYELEESVVIHKGFIETTLPAFLAEDDAATFSFIYYDADLYEPAVKMMDLCHSRLAKGGVFVFDEWNSAAWPGETRAVREFITKHPDSYEMLHVPKTRQPTLILKKVR